MLRFVATVIAVGLLVPTIARAQGVMVTDSPAAVTTDLPDADAVTSPRHPAPTIALTENGGLHADSNHTHGQSRPGSQSQTTQTTTSGMRSETR